MAESKRKGLSSCKQLVACATLHCPKAYLDGALHPMLFYPCVVTELPNASWLQHCHKDRSMCKLSLYLSKSSTALLYSLRALKHKPLFLRKSMLAPLSSCTAFSKSASAASGWPIFSSSRPLALCERALLGSRATACSKSVSASCSLQNTWVQCVNHETLTSDLGNTTQKSNVR